jgi:hypothetical protein
MAADPQRFGLRVERATFIPDEQAIRAFIDQLRHEVEGDPQLGKRLQDQPREVLCERGVAADLQRELLVASGFGGLEEGCVLTCLVTTIECGASIVIGAVE